MTEETNMTLKPWDGHTPLPWKAEWERFDKEIQIVSLSEGCAVAEVDYDDVEHDVAEADAHLICHRVNKGPAADAMAVHFEQAIALLRQLERLHDDVIIIGDVDYFEQALAAYHGEQP